MFSSLLVVQLSSCISPEPLISSLRELITTWGLVVPRLVITAKACAGSARAHRETMPRRRTTISTSPHRCGGRRDDDPRHHAVAVRRRRRYAGARRRSRGALRLAAGASNGFRHLHWLTAVTARIGTKRLFGAVANLHRGSGTLGSRRRRLSAWPPGARKFEVATLHGGGSCALARDKRYRLCPRGCCRSSLRSHPGG